MVIKNAAGVADGTDYGSSDPINVGYQTNGWYKLSTHPLYFTRTGGLGSADYYNTTTHPYYWSTTSYNGSDTYSLRASSGALYPADRYNRSNGFVVRCVEGFALYIRCIALYCIVPRHANNSRNLWSSAYTSSHAAEGPSAVAAKAVRRVYSTGIEEQVVSLRSRNSSTRPVAGVPSKVPKPGAIHAAGTDKVVRISINERIAIKSVGSIGRAAKVCAGGKNKGAPCD